MEVPARAIRLSNEQYAGFSGGSFLQIIEGIVTGGDQSIDLCRPTLGSWILLFARIWLR